MKQSVLKVLSLALLGAASFMALGGCGSSTSSATALGTRKADYTLRITVADLGGVGVTDDFSFEKEGFIIKLSHCETKGDQFQLAAAWSTMTFPRLDTMRSKYQRYYTISFEGLNNAANSLLIYDVNSSGDETLVSEALSNNSAHFGSGAVGAKLGNNDKGVYLFTAVTVTLSY
jgi:hypothetical protein